MKENVIPYMFLALAAGFRMPSVGLAQEEIGPNARPREASTTRSRIY